MCFIKAFLYVRFFVRILCCNGAAPVCTVFIKVESNPFCPPVICAFRTLRHYCLSILDQSDGKTVVAEVEAQV